MANLLVIVSYKVFPAHMGGQKGIVLFYEYLKRFHSVQMVVSYDNELEDSSYAVERLLYPNRNIGRNLFQLRLLYKLIKNNKIKCIITEHSYTGWIGLVLKIVTGVPFIIHSHNNEASRFKQMDKWGWKPYSQYERWIHQKADFSFFKTQEEMQSAISHYKLDRLKCSVIPYGIGENKKHVTAKNLLRSQYGIDSTYLFYFNGTLDYTPNKEAVERLIDSINPLLMTAGIDYTILISGKRLCNLLVEKIKATKNIRYLNFVEDASVLYQASTLFLNPVVNDSGIKTKVVEALANHCTVVSTKSGATGIPTNCAQDKLLMIEDGDWKSFTNQILACLQLPATDTPQAFFEYFSWKNIAKKASTHIEDLVNHV